MGFVGSIVLAILLGLVPAFIAQSKGKDFVTWWVYGAALFPVAVIHVLLTQPDSKTREDLALADGGKKCPYCAEVVKREAVVCRFCQRDLVTIVQSPLQNPSLTEQQEIMNQFGITYRQNRYHLDDRRFMELSAAVEYAKQHPMKATATAAVISQRRISISTASRPVLHL